MEPKHELPQANYTPAEQAKLEKSRTISDAELLKEGAEYVVNEEGEKRLLATEGQKNFVKDQKEYADRRVKDIERIESSLQRLKVTPGNLLTLKVNSSGRHSTCVLKGVPFEEFSKEKGTLTVKIERETGYVRHGNLGGGFEVTGKIFEPEVFDVSEVDSISGYDDGRYF